MAQKHPIWRGHLRLALVSCPVALYTAHKTSGDLSFHLINPKTQNRGKRGLRALGGRGVGQAVFTSAQCHGMSSSRRLLGQP